MLLHTKARQSLRAQAHKLKPVVIIGNNGLSDAVKKEIDRALHDHALIKVRIQSQDRDLRLALFEQISELLQAELIQKIGSIGVFYRERETE